MRKHLFIVLILIIATVLRLIAINPGYHSNHADEVNIYTTAITMFKAGNFEPFRYEYPPLPAYINLFAYRLFFIPLATFRYDIINIDKVLDGIVPLKMTPLAYTRFLQLEIFGDREINVLFWGRAITALFGIGVVFVFYKIGEKLYDKEVGLVTAFFIALNYREVFNSHFVLPDIYNVFFLGLAVLITFSVWKKPSFKNYLFASIACGLSFSTKYQFFSFTPLLLVHIYRVIDAKGFKNRFKVLFDPAALIVPFVIIAIFVFLNPYLFIHFDIAKPEIVYASMKYKTGRNILDFYSISYLYHYGVGQAISILTLIGLFFVPVKGIRKALFLYSILIPFFFVNIYYTGGGFYTRNFVSIIPFLLISPAVLLVEMFKKINNFRYLKYILFSILIIILSYGNIKNDFIVLSNYSKPWHKNTILSWITANIPKGSKIAAHSSVPLPDYYFTRLAYDSYPALSLEELKEEGADWAVTSFDWTTNDFYWWMVQDTAQSLKYWNRPTNVLEQSYGALAIREMQDFGVYALISSPYAPDSDFLVAHLPVYIVRDKTLQKEFNFQRDGEGWTKRGTTNLLWKDGALIINRGGTADPFTKWESPVFNLSGNGFEIDYKIKTEEEGTLKREGFLFAAFYKNENDANTDTDRVAVRLTPRNDIYNKWVNASLVGEIPNNAHYIKIGFQVYNSALSTVSLSDIKVFSVDIKNQITGTKHIDINEDIIFPISQGNL